MPNTRTSIFVNGGDDFLPGTAEGAWPDGGNHFHQAGLVGAKVLDTIYLRPPEPAVPEAERFLADGDWMTTEQKSRSFAYRLLQSGGTADFAVRRSHWGAGSDGWTGGGYWEDDGWGPAVFGRPHRYLAINSLGMFPGQTPESVLAYIGTNINDLFPWGGCRGGEHRPLRVGDTFDLTHLPYLHTNLLNSVEVVFVCDFFFIFKTRWRHVLDGIAIHGVFKDASGEFWMFQEGYGSPNTWGKVLRKSFYTVADPIYPLVDHLRDTLVNYLAAKDMWAKFARNARASLLQSARIEDLGVRLAHGVRDEIKTALAPFEPPPSP